MKTEHWNTKFIYFLRVNFTVVVFPRNRFSTSCHTDISAIKPPVIILQGGAVAAGFLFIAFAIGKHTICIFNTPAKTVGGHSHATPVFDMVTTRKVKFFIIQPPGRIYVHPTHAVFVVTFAVKQGWHNTAPGCPCRIMQVFTYYTRRIGKAFRETGRLGIE